MRNYQKLMELLKTKLADLSRFTVPKTKATSRRAHLLEQYLARINTKERTDAGYKPVTPARLGKMVAHMDEDDLEAFYKSASEYNGGFSRAFFGALKIKK